MRQIKFDAAKFKLEDKEAWLCLRIPIAFRAAARGALSGIAGGVVHTADIKRYRERR